MVVNRRVIWIMVTVTNLLQQVVNVEVHLKDRLFPAFVMQCDYKRSRCRRGDVEVNVWTPGFRVSATRPPAVTKRDGGAHLLSGTLLSTMMPSFSSCAWVKR
jgi:hypothetical protein